MKFQAAVLSLLASVAVLTALHPPGVSAAQNAATVQPGTDEQKTDILKPEHKPGPESKRKTVSIVWNGQPVQSGQASYIRSGITFVPISLLSNLKGISVHWIDEESLARLWVDRGGVFDFKPGADYAEDMDMRYPIGAAISVSNGEIMLPLRFIAEMAGADCYWDREDNQVQVIQKRNAIASVPGTRTRLFPMAERDGEYKGITLEWKEKLKSYPGWVNPSNVESPPRLEDQDIDDDGRREAIVVLNAGSGTGVYLEEIHVVDSLTYREIPVEDALQAVRSRIQSSVERSGEKLHIRVTADGSAMDQTLDRSGTAGSDSSQSKELSFGSVIRYEIRDGALIALLAGSYGISDFVGEAEVRYVKQDGKYAASSVSFFFDDE
ncbi:hypothetical protein KIH86_07075 [Paenibacillus sp. HN-1]|uniref:stalk domain-containing protein n=1 Tax=Paenibacillus TaxID=44249 RepID=UPI001CA81484|nr:MULTISPECIES: stalk domain-containing protein [Paenibacillus]MBY9080420.1 hypothetical protein [Paenibacillus sp. CGMCC 1.18879]MBY9084000.1 hypothetical protein [Paenibacillus sinensis]